MIYFKIKVYILIIIHLWIYIVCKEIVYICYEQLWVQSSGLDSFVNVSFQIHGEADTKTRDARYSLEGMLTKEKEEGSRSRQGEWCGPYTCDRKEGEGKNWARIASDHRTILKNLNQASRKLPIKGGLFCAEIDWFLYPVVTD